MRTKPTISCVGWSRTRAGSLQTWIAEARGKELVSLIPIGGDGDGLGEDTGRAAARAKREVACLAMSTEPRLAGYVKQVHSQCSGERRGPNFAGKKTTGSIDLVGIARVTDTGADDLFQAYSLTVKDGAIVQLTSEDVPTARHLAQERIKIVFFNRLVQKLVRGEYEKVPPEVERRAALKREIAAAESKALDAGTRADVERARLDELRRALVET